MADLAASLVFDVETNTLTINGQPFPWEFVELQPVLGNRPTRRGDELVPAVQLVLLGASLEILSAHTGEVDSAGQG